MISLIISFLIFLMYLVCVIRYIGEVPESLSDTYYRLGGQPFNKIKASIFTVVLWAMAFTLIPTMLDITASKWQFLAFLAIAGIMFVGGAPNFKGAENTIHTASAVVAAIFALAWSVIVGGNGGLIALGVSIFAILCVAFASKTIIRCKTFWLEMVAFFTTYITAFLV